MQQFITFLVLFSMVLCIFIPERRHNLTVVSQTSHSDEKTYESCEYEIDPSPLEDYILPLTIREFSSLNEKEAGYYRRNTWDPSKTLEQNRKTLIHNFIETCIDLVEDFVPTNDGVILKLTSKTQGLLIESAQVEEVRKRDLEELLYVMTYSPSFCQLLRSFLAKYKTLRYRPQRAIFLFTKGSANHSSCTTLHHILNLRTMNQTVLSAIDCTKHKILVGTTIFHEMLHWYHKICDNAESERRSHSKDCIRRRLRDYLPTAVFARYGEKVAEYFSNDEEYYTIFGLKEHGGELVVDTLCEATYSYEQFQYIRSCHAAFQRHVPDERQFILNFRDSALMKFFMTRPNMPQFGIGEFRCSDLGFPD
ncbi:MAG: hypothetical protein LBF54_01180 [Holosporaceae bacterium]|jgi:hypothetical protein|nr:hypothetical protein [Holosporaceae bacterium]